MRKRIVLSCLLVASVMAMLLCIAPAPAAGMPRSGPGEPSALRAAGSEPVQDLGSLLAYPDMVQITDYAGTQKDQVVATLMASTEALQLKQALGDKGYWLALRDAEASQVTVNGSGWTRSIDLVVVPARWLRLFLPLVMKGLSASAATSAARPATAGPSGSAPPAVSPTGTVAYLTGLAADDGSTFFQAHHTNLDPQLAEVPDPAIVVNGMPYFYITTLQVVGGKIAYWRYWWYDSHRHPNWYYSLYRHYWDYYDFGGHLWPGWYRWVYGWYYWRFWYYWSTYFPWVTPDQTVTGAQASPGAESLARPSTVGAHTDS